jgi:hypothetical protein
MAKLILLVLGKSKSPSQLSRLLLAEELPVLQTPLAGEAISTLLAAANPCAKVRHIHPKLHNHAKRPKLQFADKIIAELGIGTDAIKAAQGLIAAEQNFNPFIAHIPSICSDPTLPTTLVLHQMVELLPLLSLLRAPQLFLLAWLLLWLHGMSERAIRKSIAKYISGSSASCILTVTVTSTPTPEPTPPTVACGATTLVTVTRPTSASLASSAAAVILLSLSPAASSTSNSGVQKSTIAGLDFGLCVPTMKFEPGLDDRPFTESTFQAVDPLANKGQEEALNPNIITNRICDQLTNVCEANAAAKAAC